ncbi:MAG: hypothetical protein FJZ79_06660 [Chlorobi bacterium]|nr:hypothetical protein [Chlorobiota bacterium]
MASGRSNISRSIWRFFEIALFFVVSVVGFSMYAKTTTFNAKQKSRTLQQQGTGCPATLCPVSLTLFHSPFQHTVPVFAKSSREASGGFHIAFHPALSDGPLQCFRPTASGPLFLPPPVYTALPRNLLQQNPVLLT